MGLDQAFQALPQTPTLAFLKCRPAAGPLAPAAAEAPPSPLCTVSARSPSGASDVSPQSTRCGCLYGS